MDIAQSDRSELGTVDMSVFKQLATIAEDTLQFNLYPEPSSDEASTTSLGACIQAWVDETLTGFLWHRDPFELKVLQDEHAPGNGWNLEGIIRVGDCVDDEWCIVWLLREISSKWDVVIRSVFSSTLELTLRVI